MREVKMYGVMKAYGWGSINVDGVSLACPPEGPQHFIPVFDTLLQALKFTNGDEENIVVFEFAKK